MNRRDFVKFLGISAPATAAAAALSKLPGTEPKIELLSKKIVVPDEPYTIKNLTSWRLMKEYYPEILDGKMVNPVQILTPRNYYSLAPAKRGELLQMVEGEFYLENANGELITGVKLEKPASRGFQFFRFDLPELDGAVYEAIQYSEKINYKEFAMGIIKGFRVG